MLLVCIHSLNMSSNHWSAADPRCLICSQRMSSSPAALLLFISLIASHRSIYNDLYLWLTWRHFQCHLLHWISSWPFAWHRFDLELCQKVEEYPSGTDWVLKRTLYRQRRITSSMNSPSMLNDQDCIFATLQAMSLLGGYNLGRIWSSKLCCWILVCTSNPGIRRSHIATIFCSRCLKS